MPKFIHYMLVLIILVGLGACSSVDQKTKNKWAGLKNFENLTAYERPDK